METSVVCGTLLGLMLVMLDTKPPDWCARGKATQALTLPHHTVQLKRGGGSTKKRKRKTLVQSPLKKKKKQRRQNKSMLPKTGPIYFCKTNPKKKGTECHKRFEAYMHATTIEDAMEKGMTQKDLKWDADRNFCWFRVKIYRDNAKEHKVIKNGYELDDASAMLTHTEWANVGRLAAIASKPCFWTTFYDIQKDLQPTASRDVLIALGGGGLQLNVTFMKLLTDQLLQNKAGRKKLKDFSGNMLTGNLKDVDLGELVTLVDGYKDRIHSHLRLVAQNTLEEFEMDDDMMILISIYRDHDRVSKDQPRHTDNQMPGSYFSLVMFGCDADGLIYKGKVPCTRVCAYANIHSVTMNGDGWPFDWYGLAVNTPGTVDPHTSIVVAGNVIHFGPGQPEDDIDGLDLRCALFRMARHPSCKKNHDKSGDTQMLEYTYLAFNHPKKVALLKSSLERPDHADWETRIGQEEACKLHARIAKMR